MKKQFVILVDGSRQLLDDTKIAVELNNLLTLYHKIKNKILLIEATVLCMLMVQKYISFKQNNQK